LWDYGNGNVDSTTVNPTITYINPGVYDVYLYVTDSICQITDTALVTITVFDSLLVDVPNTIQLCTPVEISLTGNSFGTADQFLWSSNNQFTDQLNTNLNDSTLTITPQGSTVYYFQASNADCSIYDSVIVEFTSSSLILTGDTTLCAGEQSQITVTNQNPSINFTYTWSPNSIIANQPNSTTVNVNPPTTQYLYITASASNGCLVEDSILITVSNLGNIPVEATASEYIVVEGTTVTLTGTPSIGYTTTWTPISAVTNPANAQTTANMTSTTLFNYSVTDGICLKSDTVLVKVLEFVCGDPFIFIPNAFSPNKDGDNDILYVRSLLVTEMTFRIFDRWGEMVFESTNPANGWDGSFKGKLCDPDVYDYYLDVICVDGQKNLIKGNITLLK
jgi:gliding motility-associated-like protein